MSSNHQVPFALYHFNVRAAIILFLYIIHAREKIGTRCAHRAGDLASGIVTLLFFQGLCEASFIEHEQAVHVKGRRHFLGALLVRVRRLEVFQVSRYI